MNTTTKLFSIFSCTAFLLITGCQKQPEDVQSSEPATPAATAQFEKSDMIISQYLDQLDEPNTSKEAVSQILCHDFPTEYKTNYIPALLQLAPEDNSRKKLLQDMDIALNYYKNKLHVQCDTAH